MSEPDRIFEELRSLVAGTVRWDDMTRALYSGGGSIFRVLPRAVVQPRHAADVVEVVRFAARHRIPVTPRGGGTSRTGNEVGSGIVLDFARFMNRILEVDPTGGWVRVEPGVILAALNAHLRPHRLFFPVDPSTQDWCTLGGMIANNSSGSHAVKYGTTRDYVLELQVVLANGEVMEISPSPLAASDAPAAADGSRCERILHAVPQLLDRYADALRDERPFASKNSSGYHLWDLVQGGMLNLAPLLVGSEGSLAVVTEARLRVIPRPGKALGGLVYFDDLGQVGEATQRILELGPSMLEIMERHILDLAREQKSELRPYLPEGTEATLFVEFQEESAEALDGKFDRVRERLVGGSGPAVDLKVARDAEEMALLTKVRSISGPILNKMKGPRRPVAFIEDAAVHPSRLPEYIAGLRGLLDRFGVGAAIYGHAGDGNLHTMAFLDLRQEAEVEKMLALTEACYELVLGLNGTISGEHGDGRLRTYYVPRQYPRLYPAMEEVKRLFDPEGILNPGCVVGEGDNRLGHDLKYGPELRRVATGTALDEDSIGEQVEACSGCGKCRSYCAIARETAEEWTMGRGKATLLRELLAGNLAAVTPRLDRFKEIFDSCINCKRCLTECPSGVDIPWLAVAGRAEYVREHGQGAGNRLLADTRLLCETGSRLAALVNLANGIAPIRWGLEKAVGLDRRRRLPEFRRRTLRRLLAERAAAAPPSPPSGGREVVYFLGCYGTYSDPEGEGLATVEVLEHNGVTVTMPELRCCGIARISAGAADRVEDDLRANVEALLPYAERGVPIVFSEPSCALAVKLEYPRLLRSAAAAKVAEGCCDIHQYLMGLHRAGELRLDFGELDLTVGYHNPCHLRGLGVSREPVELLGLIPGVRAVAFSDQCCGMGGTFGLKVKNHELSLRMGRPLFAEISASPVDRLATGCGACAMQIYQGTGREAVHPISLLAEAYRAGAAAESRVAAP